MALEAIVYTRGKLEILDQLKLPELLVYKPINNVQDAWIAIKDMQVRGAPAIAIVGCLSLAVELVNDNFCEYNKKDIYKWICEKLNYLVSARPTAVNIKLAADNLIQFSDTLQCNDTIKPDDMRNRIINEIEEMLKKDVDDNRAIGRYGAEEILNLYKYQNVRILTHCNTGSLATANYGTALGVLRSLYEKKKLDICYCTETRPYNQGARLTAFELVHDNIPSVLIVDSMVGALMKLKNISAVIVGADRIAANGDTANKIGTYQIAIIAKHHSVPFYVAAPFTSIDFSVSTGDNIKIEERPADEITHVGGKRIAAEGIKCWNPSFDVTPASLITGIITERGVFKPENLILMQKC